MISRLISPGSFVWSMTMTNRLKLGETVTVANERNLGFASRKNGQQYESRCLMT